MEQTQGIRRGFCRLTIILKYCYKGQVNQQTNGNMLKCFDKPKKHELNIWQTELF